MSLDTLQTINFAGKDGFQWFFAKVVPQEHWKGTADALNFDGKQSHRAKIRVCGYDTFDDMFVLHMPTSDEILMAGKELEEMLLDTIPSLTPLQKKISDSGGCPLLSFGLSRISGYYLTKHGYFFGE